MKSFNKKQFILVVLLSLSSSFIVISAQSTLFVNETATGSNDGTSWADAYNDLQDALDAAISGDEVWVASGTYYPSKDSTGNSSPSDNRLKTFQLKRNLIVRGGFAGTESSVEERDIDSQMSILDGNLSGIRVFHVVIGADDATLDGFTVRNGNADGTLDLNTYGGGMLNDTMSDVSIRNCTFRNNKAVQGAAVANINSSNTSIENCYFIADTAVNGGAIGSFSSNATIDNCLFYKNHAYGSESTNGLGAALYVWSSGPHNIYNSTFSLNTSETSNGAIHSRGGPQINLYNCIVWGNLTNDLISSVSSNRITPTYSCVEQSGFESNEGMISGDPLLADSENGYLNLLPGSPCIDAANGDYTTTYDLKGNARNDYSNVVNSGNGTPDYADVGAIEFYPVDAGISSIDEPATEVSYSASPRDIKISLKNNMELSDLNSLEIGWSIDGVEQSPVHWTGSVSPLGTSSSVLLGEHTFLVDTTILRFWIWDPNGEKDQNQSNDTTVHTVICRTFDIGVNTLLKPEDNSPIGNNTVAVKIENFSFDSTLQSARIQWSVNEEQQPEYLWNGTVPSGSVSDLIDIGTFYFTKGSNEISVWTTDPNGKEDENNLNDTINVSINTGLPAPISGTYTIGQDQDFLDVSTAVLNLVDVGIDGPVTFNIASGTYNEQIIIPEIDGASSTNTITFQSLSGDSTDVILKYASTNSDSSYVLKLDTCSFIKFNKISIITESHVNINDMVVINNSSDIEFNNCVFDNLYYYYYTDHLIISIEDKYSADNLAIRNCSFDNGRYGIQLTGKNISEQSTGLEISGNVFLDQVDGGVKIDYYTDGIITENTLYKSPHYFAFRVNNSSLFEISYNLIEADAYTGSTDDMRMGIGLTSSEYCTIKNNRITNFATYGIEIVSGTDEISATPSTISNNFLSGGGTGIHLYWSPYQEVYHNSIHTETLCIDVVADHTTLINNIFSNRDAKPCIDINSYSTNFSSDYNNFYTESDQLGSWMGTECADLTEWQSNSSQGAHSISSNPDFISDSDLHTYSLHLNDVGLGGIENIDVDGEARDAVNPDIGADEYTPEAINLSIIELSMPVSCDLSAAEDVQIKIVNAGTSNVDNIPVTYTLDGGVTNVTETIVPQLNSGDTVTYTFTGKVDMTIPDLYSCTAFVAYTGDHVNSNDTLSQTFYSYGGVSSFPFVEDFESGISPYFELTGNSDANVILDPGSANNSAYGIKFYYSGDGGHYWDWVGGDTPDSTQLWVDNYYFQAFGKSCDIDISTLSNPALQFDMNIIAASYNKRLWFRTLIDDATELVDVDGISVYNVSNKGAYSTKTFMLDQLSVESFKITFQSCMLENGTAVYVDNIRIGEKPIVDAGSDAVICDGELASFDATAATGDQYFWFAEGNTNDTLSKVATINIGIGGTYYVDVYSEAGIKSSDTVEVQVNPTFFYQEENEICDGESILWHGETYTTSDIYYDSLLTINGCDSVYEYTLVVHPEYYFIENETICDTDSVLWHGNYYKETGSYYDSLFSMNGCDSVYQFDLLVNTSYFYTQSEEICSSESFIWRGNTYNISDTYYDSLLTINGCDSVYELKLTVHPEYFFSQEETLCGGDSILWQDAYYKTAGTYTESYASINGCDSIYELKLTVNPAYFYTEEHEICSNESFSWQGNDYSSTGTFYANYTTIDGCDSIYELNLTVFQAFESIETATICDGDSLLWHGTYYKEEGTYTDNHTSVAGCDSTYTLELAVALHYYYYESDNMCPGSYVYWHGKLCNSPGVYYDSLTTIYGCDSIYEFHLDTTRAYHFVEEADLCFGDYIIWQGSTLNSTGTYYKNYTTEAGCDSIFEMRLTVHWGYSSPTDYQTICEGDSLLWRENYYTEAGDYYDSLFTDVGCDSIFNMNLEVRPAPTDFLIEQTSDVIYTDEAVVLYLSFGEGTTQYTWEVEEGYINYNNNMEMEVVWSDTGTYEVAVYGTTQQGCTGDTKVHEAVVTYRDDGISDNRFDNRLRIYPNPVKDKLKIVYPEEIRAELYDLTGRELLITSKNEVDLSNLYSGTYIIKIKDSRNRLIYIEKLIKK